ncbi:hypothetical protein A7E78_00710 [Syntrophotalea acetylenivorans]|uniref:DUF2232 domain-containing protein n=1 Tax=Syntrophotalea acetylenivorans TaxID=1842532 RepID=A0A1L3GKN4_9BACT|nr:DUF2232 domain-containing protein [Syntrophotalea acetylenivorans]APG26513.1 hypothetical protein A7E78_00710 [Syntrophotalea acetylenivorans]
MKQVQAGSFIVGATLVTLLLQGSVGLLPVGALAALLVPLPAAYVVMRFGLTAGCLVVAGTSGIAYGLISQVAAVGYLVQFGAPALLLSLLLRRGVDWCRATGWSLILLLATGGLFLLAMAVQQQTELTTLVESYLQVEINTALTLAKDMELPAAQAAQFEKTVRNTGALLLQVYPAAAAVGYGLLLLITQLGLSLAARSRYSIPGIPFDQWKVPEVWIWGLILSGAGVLLANGGLETAALNLLVVMLALYFLQGLAIVKYFFRTRRVSTPLRTLGYVLLATLNPLPVLVAGIGVFDLWIDFRKPRKTED